MLYMLRDHIKNLTSFLHGDFYINKTGNRTNNNESLNKFWTEVLIFEV